MIAVDTSAIVAVLLGEPRASACRETLEAADELLISAANVAETLIVAHRRNLRAEAARFIDEFGFEVVSVGPASALRVAAVYARWGRGAHPASLNFGDCFAYDLANERGCPLLYVGNDFSRTDIESALPL